MNPFQPLASRAQYVGLQRLGGSVAAPDADAVFVAHTDLDQIASITELWSAIPDRKTLHIS